MQTLALLVLIAVALILLAIALLNGEWRIERKRRRGARDLLHQSQPRGLPWRAPKPIVS